MLPERTVEVGATKWLALQSLAYVDRAGNERAWDRCVRKTRQSEDAVDAVAILAVLQFPNAPPQTILVRQFRPPVGSYTVELPAGLIDEGETPAQAAVRELHEETGLVAEVDACSLSPPLVLSPGLTNENVVLVTVPVDMSRPENHPDSAKQDLDEGEDIELITCGLGELHGTLSRLQQDEGLLVFAGLYTLAAGMTLAAKL
jgi:8-oxo-dGTP pyrophosphatase MutT (NUDIX family)